MDNFKFSIHCSKKTIICNIVTEGCYRCVAKTHYFIIEGKYTGQ